MQARLFSALGRAAGIGGLALGVFLYIFQGVLEKDFLHALTQEQAYRILLALMIFTFGIAGIGVIAWLIGKTVGPEQPMPSRALYVLAALVLFIIAASVYVAATPPPHQPGLGRGPISDPGPSKPTSRPEPGPPTLQPPNGYDVVGIRVRDKNGKAANLIKIVSHDHRWVLGKIDEVEFQGTTKSLSILFGTRDLKDYLTKLDAVIGVGVASNETINDNNKKEEDRAMDRAVRIQYEIKQILSSQPNIAYYALSLGRNQTSPSGASPDDKKRSSAEQRRVIILGIKQESEKVDFDSIITKDAIGRIKLLDLDIDQYSQFILRGMRDRLQ